MSHSTAQGWVFVVEQSPALLSAQLMVLGCGQGLWAGHGGSSCTAAAHPCSLHPQGVPVPRTRWALMDDPAGKSPVNHWVLMHEIMEQSCTH